MSQIHTQMNRTSSVGSTPSIAPDTKQNLKTDGDAFKALLKDKIDSTPFQQQQQKGVADQIKFSAHAVDRMQSRGISLGADGLERLAQAVEKAAKKGSKDTLVIFDNSAMIVNVKNKTVVTAMDREGMKENIFTNIDSTVMA